MFLDALGAERIPDPTTAGDFCRRFTEADVERLMDSVNETRLRVRGQQPEDFFAEAFRDADGTVAPSDGWCKQGVDLASNGVWGDHPLVVSLANTAEPLYLVNRSGHRPSHEPADISLDQAAALGRRAGSRTITYRGDTDFSQTKHLDRWDRDPIRFLFGIDAMANLTGLAERLPELRSSEPERPPRYTIQTVPRPARERPKGRVVAARQFEALKLIGEEVAEFEDRPVACKATYRVVVLGKELVVETGPLGLFEPDRYYFYLTNDRTTPASEIVFLAMASLAWSLKAWAALLLPEHPRWAERPRAEERSLRRMESSTSCGALIQVPCQIVRAAGRIVYRLLSWNPWRGAFLRLVERLHGLRLC